MASQLTRRAASSIIRPQIRAASSVASVSLSNIEASWKGLSPAEQESTFKALEELQKKDWKELSIDEKKAAYYVAFGPHGPREPILPPGSGAKTVGAVALAVTAAFGLFSIVRSFGSEVPKTVNKEWEEAATQRAIEQKQDPFTGPASEGYKGKGYVVSKK
ncbi:cytochrome c oxidase subunit IV [Meredithblackwellia eburnea MCA 4105]